MSLERSFDGSDAFRPDPAGALREERRAVRMLASGTLACPACDAPVAVPGRVAPSHPMGCPYCGEWGAVRDFLTLESPSRPAHVVVRVVERLRSRSS